MEVSLRFPDLLKPAHGSDQVLTKSQKSSNSVSAKHPNGNGGYAGQMDI